MQIVPGWRLGERLKTASLIHQLSLNAGIKGTAAAIINNGSGPDAQNSPPPREFSSAATRGTMDRSTASPWYRRCTSTWRTMSAPRLTVEYAKYHSRVAHRRAHDKKEASRTVARSLRSRGALSRYLRYRAVTNTHAMFQPSRPRTCSFHQRAQCFAEYCASGFTYPRRASS